MSDSGCIAINFDKYLSLLDLLVPTAVRITLRDGVGKEVAGVGAVPVEKTAPPGGQKTNVYLFEVRDQDETLVSLAIEISCDRDKTPAQGETDSMHKAVQLVLDCMQEELRLTAELDAMAVELGERYEELNLVYASNDPSNEQENEEEALSELVAYCVDFMGNELTVVFYGRDGVFHAVNARNSIRDPRRIIEGLRSSLVPEVKQSGNTLVINRIDDVPLLRSFPARDKKLLACPVKSGQDAVVAVLVSVNGSQSTDYSNSDRNLLEAMARKISKIEQINHDFLTGLMKQRRFERVLSPLFRSAREGQETHCMIQFDLEKLQVINDLYGREAGDDLIVWVADHLRSMVRETDAVAYFGSGKYGVLIKNADESQGLAVAESIRQALSEAKYPRKGKTLQISLCAGVAVIDRDSVSVVSVMESAELALDAAKTKGGNRTRVYRSNDVELRYRKEEMKYLNYVQEALRNDLFVLYCQPIKPSRKADSQVHCEVLLRLPDENGKLMPPGLFLSAAEHYYLMPVIDKWVIENTFKYVAKSGFMEHFKQVLVSINLSGQSLDEEGLAVYINERLGYYALNPERFCFEITETAAFESLDNANRVVSDLKAKGFRFSLDDFGTGLSSFSYLKELPVDYLKIDGYFVRNILEDKVAHAMVESINQVGHVMNLETIAEFVENEAVSKCLAEIGVDYLQGYGIAKPLPLEDYIRELLSGCVAAAG
jgi:diguanylate cyclase (GGDEF)-like protein